MFCSKFFILAGVFIPVDYSGEYVVENISISFKPPDDISCGNLTNVAGCATINGSEMRLSSRQGFLEAYTTCNHEMVHVRGVGDHSDFTFLELTGFRPTGVCGELVFGKII